MDDNVELLKVYYGYGRKFCKHVDAVASSLIKVDSLSQSHSLARRVEGVLIVVVVVVCWDARASVSAQNNAVLPKHSFAFNGNTRERYIIQLTQTLFVDGDVFPNN